jgi:hypothetical protein
MSLVSTTLLVRNEISTRQVYNNRDVEDCLHPAL